MYVCIHLYIMYYYKGWWNAGTSAYAYRIHKIRKNRTYREAIKIKFMLYHNICIYNTIYIRPDETYRAYACLCVFISYSK